MFSATPGICTTSPFRICRASHSILTKLLTRVHDLQHGHQEHWHEPRYIQGDAFCEPVSCHEEQYEQAAEFDLLEAVPEIQQPDWQAEDGPEYCEDLLPVDPGEVEERVRVGRFRPGRAARRADFLEPEKARGDTARQGATGLRKATHSSIAGLSDRTSVPSSRLVLVQHSRQLNCTGQ